jgi:phosphotransacetylase
MDERIAELESQIRALETTKKYEKWVAEREITRPLNLENRRRAVRERRKYGSAILVKRDAVDACMYGSRI